MHVVIDLGETHTYLACWERGKPLEDACIKVILPGVAAFKSSGGNYTWECDHLREYLSYIYREYLLPSRIIIESAALAIPDVFDLRHRRILLDILEEILGLYEASIIPHPLALTAGLQMRNPQSPLFGDILIIEEQESSCSCAFISIIESIGITLEKQFQGSVSELLSQANEYGYYSAEGWRLDHLLLSGPSMNGPAIGKFIASLPSTVNIIYGHDLEFAAAEGLSTRNNGKGTAPTFRFNLIYPYQFYLEKNNSNLLEKLPFDTANLELDCDGQYAITSLNRASMENPGADDNRIRFHIYEFKTSEEQIHKSPPVLEIDSTPDDLPPQMELGLDMAAASLQLDLVPESAGDTINAPEFLEIRLQGNQKQLYQMLKQCRQNQALLNDWNNYLLSPPADGLTLSEQIDHTLFHLYGLLQLWNDK